MAPAGEFRNRHTSRWSLGGVMSSVPERRK